MEDQIQLTDVLKAFVQSLDKDLDEVENTQLWLWAVDTEDKVEGGVVPVYELVVWASYETAALQEVTDVVVPLTDQLEGLLNDLLLLWLILQILSQSVLIISCHRDTYIILIKFVQPRLPVIVKY